MIAGKYTVLTKWLVKVSSGGPDAKLPRLPRPHVCTDLAAYDTSLRNPRRTRQPPRTLQNIWKVPLRRTRTRFWRLPCEMKCEVEHPSLPNYLRTATAEPQETTLSCQGHPNAEARPQHISSAAPTVGRVGRIVGNITSAAKEPPNRRPHGRQ